MRSSIFVLLAWAAATVALAQAPATEPSPVSRSDHRTTPRSAVFGFLEAAREGNLSRAAQFLDLRNWNERGRTQSAAETAQHLKRVLDRKLQGDLADLSPLPEGDTLDGLPPDQELLAEVPLHDRTVNLMLERVTLDEGHRVWLFSQNTVALVPRLYADIDNHWIEERLPSALVDTTIFDTALWQWLALLLIALIGVAFARLIARLVVAVIRPLAARTNSELDDRIIDSLKGPLRLLLVVITCRIGLEFVLPPVLVRTFLTRILAALAYLAIAWLLMRITDAVAVQLTSVMSRRARASATSVVPLARRTVKVIVVLAAIVATLDFWGFNTTALIAGLGVGGLAVALAAQKTLEDLFGGLSIISDRPVLVGDFCKFGDRVGTVEDIGLRSTRIRTLDRTIVTVPNGQFSSMLLENFGMRDKIWFHPTVGVRRDTTATQVRQLLRDFDEVLSSHPLVAPGDKRVRFLGPATPHSLDFELFAYVLTANFDEFLGVQDHLMLGVMDAVERAGTALAVPTQLNWGPEEGSPKGGQLTPPSAS